MCPPEPFVVVDPEALTPTIAHRVNEEPTQRQQNQQQHEQQQWKLGSRSVNANQSDQLQRSENQGGTLQSMFFNERVHTAIIFLKLNLVSKWLLLALPVSISHLVSQLCQGPR